jgi:large subunit ribosomal protein L22
MPGLKTNEREGTRAVLRHARLSPYKVREVLNLIRNRPVTEAEDILRFSDRDAAILVGKVLHSAVANAENNDELDPEELYVSACFADEGTTIKRWRPRARGRATRIRKRTSHITVIVSRLSDQEIRRLQQHRRAEQLAARARRVAGARRAEGDTRSRAERRHPNLIEDIEEEHDHEHEDHDHDEEVEAEDVEGGAPTDTELGAAEGETDSEEAAETAEQQPEAEAAEQQPEAEAAEQQPEAEASPTTETKATKQAEADDEGEEK